MTVTKFLAGTPTYNTYPGSNEVGSNRNVNMTIIQFLEDYLHAHPEDLPEYVDHNDISVTKFL